MFNRHNPKKDLIKELRKSEELYHKLIIITKKEAKLKNRAQDHIQDIHDFINYIQTLSAKQIEELIDEI